MNENQELQLAIMMLSFSVIGMTLGFLMGLDGIVAMWGFFSMCLLSVIFIFYTTSGDSDDDVPELPAEDGGR